jgi:hypothetical protein
MRNAYPLVAAAVATVLGGASAYAGTASTLAQAKAPAVSLVVAGSSAAQNGFAQGLANDLCGGTGNITIIKGVQATGVNAPAGNFQAYSCVPSSGAGGLSTSLANGTNVFTIWYRAEGGSVVGALPLAYGADTGNLKIKRLNLNDSTCGGTVPSLTCTVTGASSVVGTTDGWTGAVVEDYVQLGITDVEPAQFGNGSDLADYPTAYSTSVFGNPSPSDLSNLNPNALFSQVFGLFVNTSGLGTTVVNLTTESAANILLGNYTSWAKVPDAVTGNAVGTGAITLYNREAGSGTRTGANIFFLGYGCTTSLEVADAGAQYDYYATGDALNAANAKGGSITYASIDNAGTKYPNLVVATLNGIAPSNLAAATGEYDWWFEATAIPNTSTYLSGSSLTLANWVQGELAEYNHAPSQNDIVAIPGAGSPTANIAKVPLQAGIATGGSTTVYTNPYSRNGNSCTAAPTEQN